MPVNGEKGLYEYFVDADDDRSSLREKGKGSSGEESRGSEDQDRRKGDEKSQGEDHRKRGLLSMIKN